METEPTAAPNRGWAFYIVLFWAIAAAGVAFGLADAALGPGSGKTSTTHSALVMGDFNARMALVAPRISADPTAYAQSALAHYSTSPADPAAYRRIGIVKQVLLGQSGLEDLTRAGGREADLWRGVYGGRRPTPDDAAMYLRFIKKLDIGPLQKAAEAEVYARAGMLDEANAALSEAREASFRVVASQMSVIGALGLMFVAGMFMLGRFLARPASEAVTAWDVGSATRILFPTFVAYMCCGIVFTSAAGLTAEALDPEGVLLELILAVVANVGAFLVGLWVLRLRTAEAGIDYRSIGLRAVPAFRVVTLGLVGYCSALPPMGAALGVALVLQQTVFRHFPTSEHPVVPMMLGGGAALWLAYALGVVVAPVIEETFFRGVLYGGLRSRMGMWGAAGFSGLLFASIHPTLPTGFLPIMVLGMGLAVLREKTGSLYPCMFCHALNNAIMLTAAMLSY